ncbi:HEAT repeat domain-containing protein [Heliorestis acidaminivorans]|uniref:HEAT repeat domain-containing protein n=1 Tax=Heliorestis acidaminivorans TaxID=553427 RepID=A0A6I0F1R3_9FIRM|nr:HEAT repeat domain-containing protein [Heliorestis acidaminivorans]KAB2953871.1 HEAT repeat domain-containing protein [Heliorestis acidaminivorans]
MEGKISWWQKWFFRKTKPREGIELVKYLLSKLEEGLPPTAEELASVKKASLEDRARWWREAVQGTSSPALYCEVADQTASASATELLDTRGTAWRLARILNLETYWLSLIETPGAEKKEELLEVIGKLPIPQALPVLKKALLGHGPAVGFTATMLLAQRPEEEVTDFFLSVLHRQEGGPWMDRAARGLSARRILKGKEIWQKLIVMTNHEKIEIRLRAWEVVISFGPPTEQEEWPGLDRALCRGLSDSSEKVRAQVAVAAGVLARPTLVEKLIESLQDPEARVRAEAARSLGRLGSLELLRPSYQEKVVQTLQHCLEDEDYRVNGCAHQALQALSR